MHGGRLQMGCRPSKAANTAAAMCMRSETDSDYIAQANWSGQGIFPPRSFVERKEK